MPSRPRIEVTASELALAVVGACVLAVIMHWPLVLHLGADIPKDLGDPLPQSWQVAWGGHALLDQPLGMFQSNQFWPLEDTLAFSDALIGYAPAGLLGSGPAAAAARYDVLFLLAYALCFCGAYLLARELGVGRAGALVAGAAFAFAPFRLEQDGHLQVISSGGIPLALALAFRGVRLARPGWLFAGLLTAAWQVSLGFTLGLPLLYLLACIGLLAALAWLARGRPKLDRRLLRAGLAGAAVLVAVVGLLSRPYMRVQADQPQARRSPATVEAYSGDPVAFLAAPDENLVWGGATAVARDGLRNVPEQTLFCGLMTLALAGAGIGWRGWPRWLRWSLAGATVAIWVLALGFREQGGLLWPYRIVYDLLPGWEGIRTPGRLVTFSSLSLALLAAAGVARLAEMLGRRRATAAAWARSSALVGVVAALLVVVEGRGLPFDPTDSQAQPRVPAAPADVSEVPAPQLHLPAELAPDNRRYLLWSTDGFPDLVNGRSSVQPELTGRVIHETRDFPDADSAERLRQLGVRSVIVHLDRARGTPFADTLSQPIAGLGLNRHRLGDLVVYEIRSETETSPRPGA